MKWDNPYVSIQSKMESLQRWLIVHAHIYYNYNNNVVTDKMWDDNAYQLVDMKKQYPKTYKKTFYYPVMNDFDGSTGFDLFDRLQKWNKEHSDYLDTIASHVVRQAGKNGKKVAKREKQLFTTVPIV